MMIPIRKFLRAVGPLLTILVFGTISIWAIEAYAQSKQRAVKLVHKVPSPKTLPYPGEDFHLTVTLKNTKITERILSVQLLRDGESFRMALDDSRFNEFDEPTYKITLAAPVAELIYQFVLQSDDTSPTVVSPRYKVQRGCIPDITPKSPQLTGDITVKERISGLAEQALYLERKVKDYEAATKLAQKVKELLDE